MSTGVGVKSYMAIGKETTFGTGVAVTNKIPLLSEGITPNYERIPSDWLAGKAGQLADDQGPQSITGPTDIVLCYDQKDTTFVGSDMPLALAMGTVTWAAGTATNQLTLAESPATFATMAFEKTVGIHEITGCIPNGFTSKGSPKDKVTATLPWIGYNYLITGTTNNSASFTGLATAIPNKLIHNDLVVRMATDFSDALAVGDKIAISEWVLNYDSKLSDPEFATPLNAASAPYQTSGVLTMQPERNGFRNVTLELTIPRYAANTWLTAYQADSPIQADFTFTGSATEHLYIYFPYMKIIEFPTANISGPGIIPLKIKLQCFRGASYSNGTGNAYSVFTDTTTVIAEEFAIETDNERTAAIF